ncbi:cytochrome P450 [Mucor mucedo]|uniref:cytochrome P450 n=1 Tax=Mucor mucedo TaxID=29922 RepID=UPI00221FC006|nr:cytochrome P450 [Mucor mucedo]KAI7890607.1 cytochrome P450 [Mucor mucedo]
MDFYTTLQQIQETSQTALAYLSQGGNAEKIGAITAISVATYFVGNKLYDAFFGTLSNVPGPFITRFMDIPLLLLDIPRGTSFKRLRDYHDIYGDIVRLGPKKIAISNKDLMRQVLVTEDHPKSPFYEIIQATGKLSVFSATDKGWHKKRRRMIAPAFSIKYLNSLEPYVSKVANSLIEKIDGDIAEKHDTDNFGQVDIWTLFKCYALDVIGETAFGSSFNMIEDNSHFIPQAINDELRESAISAMFPFLKIFLKNGGRTNPKITDFLKNMIEKRMQDTDNKRQDILQSLIDAKDAENENDRLDTAAIMSETGFFLVAGSETTSNTLGFTVISLLREPHTLTRLVAEIDTVELAPGQTIFKHDQIKHLPYLNAVLNESMRVFTAAGGAIPRITEKATRLGDLELEKDTVIMNTLYHVNTSSKYWPDPFKFKPERWLPEEQDDTEFNDLDAFFAFSAGSRNCIGKNFALMEMRLCLAALLKHFEFVAIPSEMEDALELRTFITLAVAKHTFDCKMRRRVL